MFGKFNQFGSRQSTQSNAKRLLCVPFPYSSYNVVEGEVERSHTMRPAVSIEYIRLHVALGCRFDPRGFSCLLNLCLNRVGTSDSTNKYHDYSGAIRGSDTGATVADCDSSINSRAPSAKRPWAISLPSCCACDSNDPLPSDR